MAKGKLGQGWIKLSFIDQKKLNEALAHQSRTAPWTALARIAAYFAKFKSQSKSREAASRLKKSFHFL